MDLTPNLDLILIWYNPIVVYTPLTQSRTIESGGCDAALTDDEKYAVQYLGEKVGKPKQER